jgi:ATP-dependent RNA helicase RhlB
MDWERKDGEGVDERSAPSAAAVSHDGAEHVPQQYAAGDESETTHDASAGVEAPAAGAPFADAEAEDAEEEAPELLTDDGEGEEGRRRRPPGPSMEPEKIARTIHTFDDLDMHAKIREAVTQMGWTSPTPVQKLCLPFTLAGRDVAGFAQTGTGKTAVFLMTICNRLLADEAAASVEGRAPRAVVLAPTRELAMQIEQDAEEMSKTTGLSTLAVFGGVDFDKQAKKLQEGVDIIFATPGRMMDYIKRKMVSLEKIEVFVCDEADRMFDMGFIDDVEFFLERIPEGAQKLLFSATTNEQVKELAFEYLDQPEYISVNPEVITPEKIEQTCLHCNATQKLRVMIGLLREQNPECAIIFTNTKLTAEWLHLKLAGNGIESDLITGDLPQSKRIRLIHRIKEGTVKLLIATDVASRGLHISRVTHVYNFDLPDEPANYVHRIGRTARAGARGSAISLVCDDYGQNLAEINVLLGGTTTLKSDWPPEQYLAIEDKAGNPFEGREMRRGGDRDRDRDRDRGPRGGRGGDRPQRAGGERGERGDRDRERGPREGRAGGEGRGGQGGRGGEGRGGQGGRGGEGRGGEGRGGQAGQGQARQHDRPRMDREQGAEGGEGKRKRRRRRGRGRDGEQQPQGQLGDQRQGGRGQGGRTGANLAASDSAPKGFFAMIVQFFKAVFGRK